jgi:hypothetical protein
MKGLYLYDLFLPDPFLFNYVQSWHIPQYSVVIGSVVQYHTTKNDPLLHVQVNGEDVFVSIKVFTRSLHYYKKKYGQIYTLATVFKPLIPELEQSCMPQKNSKDRIAKLR